MELKDHIDDICKKLREGVFIKEAEVSNSIVMRLLGVLKWPQYDPQIVKPEYEVKNLRVDFALCDPADNPVVFIEVKQVGNLSGAEEQLFNYAFHKGIPIAILTDGQHWNFFNPIGKGNYENRKVRELDLLKSDSEESVKCISRYLSYDAIQSGEAVRAIEADYQNVVKQRQIEKRLPEAWWELLQDEDELLIEIMVDKTKSLCNNVPTKEQVLTFLRSLEKKKTESVSFTPSDKPIITQPGDILLPDGKVIKRSNKASDTFFDVIEGLGCDEVMRVAPDIVSADDFPSYQKKGRPCRKHNGKHFIYVSISRESMAGNLKKITTRLDISLEVEF